MALKDTAAGRALLKEQDAQVKESERQAKEDRARAAKNAELKPIGKRN